MQNDGKIIPIRFYSEFWDNDWPAFPPWVQQELATFLETLQANPLSLEITGRCEIDRKKRIGYKFCDGYKIFWTLEYSNNPTLPDLNSWPTRIIVLEARKE